MVFGVEDLFQTWLPVVAYQWAGMRLDLVASWLACASHGSWQTRIARESREDHDVRQQRRGLVADCLQASGRVDARPM